MTTPRHPGAPRRIAGALLLALACSAAIAQDDTPAARKAAALALVDNLHALTNPERMFRQGLDAARGQLSQQIRGDGALTDAQRERALAVLFDAIGEGQAEMIRELMPVMSDGMAQAYADKLTLAEIRELRTFYESGLGRKAIAAMVDDMPRVMAAQIVRMQQFAPRLERRIAAARQQLRDEGIPIK